MHEETLDSDTHTEKSRGRIEIRRCDAIAGVEAWLDWPGARQLIRITRETWSPGDDEPRISRSYYVTSQPRSRADAATLNRQIRERWRVETSCHAVLDLAFREDACRVRRGSTPILFGYLRRALLPILDLLNAESTPAAMRALAAQPHATLALLNDQPVNVIL